MGEVGEGGRGDGAWGGQGGVPEPGVVWAGFARVEGLRGAGHEDPGRALGEGRGVDVAEEAAGEGEGAEACGLEGCVGGGGVVWIAVEEGDGGETVVGKGGEIVGGVLSDDGCREGPAEDSEGGAALVGEEVGFPAAALSEEAEGVWGHTPCEEGEDFGVVVAGDGEGGDAGGGETVEPGLQWADGFPEAV